MREKWGDYLEVSPDASSYTREGAQFSLLSHDHFLNATLRATLSTPLPDGTIYTSVSDTLVIRVSDEYIDLNTTVDGVSKGTIDTTLTVQVGISYVPMTITGAILPDVFPYTLDIYDAFDDTLIESGITLPNKNSLLSYTYSKKIGSYKLVIKD